MKLRIRSSDPATASVDALVLPFVPPTRRGAKSSLPCSELLPAQSRKWAATELDATTWLQTTKGKAPRALLVSLGAALTVDEAHGSACGSASQYSLGLGQARSRRGLGARIERSARAAGLRKVAVYVGADVQLGALIAEGLRMRAYRYSEHVPDGERPQGLREVQILVDKGVLVRARGEIQGAWARAEATNLARGIADLPPNLGTPEAIVKRVRALAQGSGLKVSAMGRGRLQREGLRLIQAVDRGAKHPARVLRLEHNAARSAELPTLVWIGKGVTMDAGGYDLKRSGAHEMNYDKAGAAAVVGAMLGAAELGLDVHVVALCPFVENLVGKDALQPGEVIEAHDGTQVYVENTDAEGRLLIADLLSYSAELEADLTVDLATLTGASHVALGEPYAALFSNDDAGRELLVACGERSDDRVWPMPIHDLHDRELAHPRADLKNVGAHAAGASAAAAFLRYFVQGPWAHIDMAGKAHFGYERDYTGAGATGYGTRLLLEVARTVAQRGGLHT